MASSLWDGYKASLKKAIKRKPSRMSGIQCVQYYLSTMYSLQFVHCHVEHVWRCAHAKHDAIPAGRPTSFSDLHQQTHTPSP